MRSHTWTWHCLSFSSLTSAEERTSDTTERRGTQRCVCVRVRGCVRECVCARMCTNTKLEWWESVPADDVTFSIPPTLFVLHFWPTHKKPPAIVFYIAHYSHFGRITRVNHPHFHPVTFLPLPNYSEDSPLQGEETSAPGWALCWDPSPQHSMRNSCYKACLLPLTSRISPV